MKVLIFVCISEYQMGVLIYTTEGRALLLYLLLPDQVYLTQQSIHFYSGANQMKQPEADFFLQSGRSERREFAPIRLHRWPVTDFQHLPQYLQPLHPFQRQLLEQCNQCSPMP